MRNGNPSKQTLNKLATEFGSYPTYEEWKLLNQTIIP